jgi:hypothetical protein
VPAQHLLIDALRLPADPCRKPALIKGDARSLSIAAASVLAKTPVMRCMDTVYEQYPGLWLCPPQRLRHAAYTWKRSSAWALPHPSLLLFAHRQF